ncbi:MAG: hypothetical protein ACC657_11255 [Thiohalomonadales bacterium]
MMQQEFQQHSNIISFPEQKKQLTTASITKIENGLPVEVLLTNHISTFTVVGVFNSQISWSLHDTVKVLVCHHRAVVYENMALFSKQSHDLITLDDEKPRLHYSNDVYIRSGETVIIIKPDGCLQVDVNTLDNMGIWCLNIMGYRLAIS